MTTPHQILNPESLVEPKGFSHVVVASPGKTVYLGGATAHDRDGNVVGNTVYEQFDKAASNVVEALAAAGAEPEHLVAMQIYVTDSAVYRAELEELSTVYRKHFGRHYPAVALLEVKALFDPRALVELVCTAVVPGG